MRWSGSTIIAAISSCSDNNVSTVARSLNGAISISSYRVGMPALSGTAWENSQHLGKAHLGFSAHAMIAAFKFQDFCLSCKGSGQPQGIHIRLAA